MKPLPGTSNVIHGNPEGTCDSWGSTSGSFFNAGYEPGQRGTLNYGDTILSVSSIMWSQDGGINVDERDRMLA